MLKQTEKKTFSIQCNKDNSWEQTFLQKQTSQRQAISLKHWRYLCLKFRAGWRRFNLGYNSIICFQLSLPLKASEWSCPLPKIWVMLIFHQLLNVLWRQREFLSWSNLSLAQECVPRSVLGILNMPAFLLGSQILHFICGFFAEEFPLPSHRGRKSLIALD